MPRNTRSEKADAAAQRRLNFELSNSTHDASPLVSTTTPATRPKRSTTNDSNTTNVSSPLKKKQKNSAVAVTPEEQEAAVKKREQEATAISKYVPKYIHANVSYKTKGTSKLDLNTIKVYEWIEDHYEIPVDLEQRRSCGPLSGSSYEERVIQQYELGKLKIKDIKEEIDYAKEEQHAVICTCCAETGHKRNDCPSLI
ncbi:hypothetical protein MPSEU_000577500 [Mayamaea pseudoterrestris]|nr:hypothetical protein MPSEU_000577500 [Mayamaea pseudoterrestris]